MKENKSRAGAGGGVKQRKNLPFFCLANHNILIHTVITRDKLVIIFLIKLFKRVYSQTTYQNITGIHI